MLSVKIGQYHPALENSFVNTIQTLKKDDPLTPIVVVAPTNWMLNRLQERLVQGYDTSACLKHTEAGFINISFVNFFTLAKEICKRSETDTGQIIQKSVIYECVVAGLLRQRTLKEPIFKDIKSTSTLALSLFRVVQDLNDANINVNDLKEAIREGFIDSAEIQKLYGVVHLYDMFKQRLKSLNMSDYSGVYRLATACLPDSNFLKGFKYILAYGFYDLTGVEQDLFREIFRLYPTILFLPYQKKHPAFSYVKPFFESFALGLACDVDEIPTSDSSGFSYLMDFKSEDDSAASCGLRDTSCKLNTQPTTHNSQHETRNTKSLSDIHIINASGLRDETWTVAKEILKFADKGYKMEEIGVVARTLEPYTDVIKNVFQENCIPFITSAQEPIARYPLVKVIQRILMLKREKYYRPMVTELLGSPYFRMPAFDYKGDAPRPDLWDVLSRSLGIRYGIECWLSRLKQAKSKLSDIECDAYKSKENKEENCGFSVAEEETERHFYVPAVQIELLENVLHKLANDISSLPEKAPWTVMSYKITHFLQKYIHIPSECMNQEDRKRDCQIMNKILELLHVLCTLDCLNEEVTIDQFVDTLIDLCQRESISIGLDNGRGVKVLDAMSARGIPFRVLFVLGLNEKVFPRAISEEPFLRDHVRRKLSDVLGNCIPEKLRGFEEEYLLFYFLLNAAREQLYLIYERSDEAGKPEIQSHYLMEIVRNMQRTSVGVKTYKEKSEYEVYVPRGIKDKFLTKEISLLTPKEIGIRLAIDRIDPANFMKLFKINRDAFVHAQSALDYIESYNHNLTSYDGVVGDMSGWWKGHGYRGFSPTAIEVFGLCPFKFFMSKILELEPLDEPEKVDEIPSVDLGSLYHNILRDFYSRLIKKRYFDSMAKEVNPVELLHDIAKKYFTEVERQMPISYPILWEIKKEEIIAYLTRFITCDLERVKQTGFIPTYLERVVKLCLQNDLIKLVPVHPKTVETSELTFKGKIDRIDLKKEENTISFRVVDYKSGKFTKENLIKSALKGQKLQLPFYIIMAEHVLSEEIKKGLITEGQIKLDNASFVYITQDGEGKKGQKEIPEKTIEGGDWKDFKGQCWETLKEFLQYIHDGIFPISPAEDTQKCEWCEFSTVCRRGHQPLRFRLEQDARLKKYLEIRNLNISKKTNKS